MLWIIVFLLLGLWFAGACLFYAGGYFVHIMFIVALGLIVYRIKKGGENT